MKLSERDFQRQKAKHLAALAKDPMDFAARNDLGLLLWNAGKRKEAFELFLDAVKRHPTNATAHANLAFMFLRGGALAEARTLYE
ncbi:MAG: tetratricopeptide repeat protein, partial [Vulcanimicrobiaceae bacterium]